RSLAPVVTSNHLGRWPHREFCVFSDSLQETPAERLQREPLGHDTAGSVSVKGPLCHPADNPWILRFAQPMLPLRVANGVEPVALHRSSSGLLIRKQDRGRQQPSCRSQWARSSSYSVCGSCERDLIANH